MFELAIIISTLGNFISTIIIILMLIIFLFYFKHKKEAAIVFLASSISFLTTFLLKIIFQIPRPLDALVLELDYRFPSGHATTAGAIFTLVLYFSSSYLKNKTYKHTANILVLSWLISLCWARLYLGVHYFVDVLVGSLIGIFTTFLAIYFINHRK